MANVRTSIDIEAPVQDVWGLVTDLDRLGEWVSIHRDFPEPPPQQGEPGTSFRQMLAVAGASFPRTTYSLEEQNGGTRFEYENEFRLPAGEIGEAAWSPATRRVSPTTRSSASSGRPGPEPS